MALTKQDIQQVIKTLNLSELPLCVHSSLRSFGPIEGGSDTLLDGLLAEDTTVMVPTFTDQFFPVTPPVDPNFRPARNGLDDGHVWQDSGAQRIYTPATGEIDDDMGILPRTVLARPEHVRGNHPLNSFAAIGPLAEELIEGQQPLQVYMPMDVLAELRGSIILMGVGLERMTFLHFAEQEANRTLFRRWANGPDGRPMLVAVGSCSEGFGNFAPVLASLKREVQVGQSVWQIFPARETLSAAVAAIRANPSITHCADPACSRCNHAVQGGPILPEQS
ncbi:AAC(3) family N-acetyltransferase [Reticulibacter mediterranei]|uniref:Aminoglycoside N(3)-acetyltransferase n=1 Tax=Reticulibacter mediterranei TaxID=2778369 RepID=A0A8J3IEZ2_9CHLR|nr:AAC(3) family N-acetyltransferase [Reticulibacter mediterranei]GHO91295.1 AAC(3) family N-acetyltransferase [Reticulibacter mediterranei]